MGLDMYLAARKGISGAEWSTDQEQLVYQVVTTAIGLDEETTEKLARDYGSISLTVGYWRKAHEIHRWFVDTVQDGNDNCAEYYVSRDNLTKLKESIEVVLADPEKMSKEFPEEYARREWDEWVEAEYKRTQEMIELILSSKFDDWEFSYQSSW